MRCSPRLRAGDKVLVAPTVGAPFLAASRDLRPYRADLDGAVVCDDDLRDGSDLLLARQPWTSALVARALHGIDMSRPGATAAARLLSNGRRPGTLASHEGKFDRFFRFCTDVQAELGHEPLCPMPATQSTVLLYLGFLQEEDKVHARSLQPYMSAINQAHIDFGFPAPAVGQLLRLARRGFGEIEGGSTLTPVRRAPLPASVVWRALQLGLSTHDPRLLRACSCVVFQFLWFARADTGIQLREAHVGVSEFGITLNERTKTIARHVAAPVSRPFDAAWDPDGLVLALLLRWRSVRGPVAADAFFWALPEDDVCSSTWCSAAISTWLQEVLGALGVAPPVGCSWSSHSLRSGGASAAFALGVDLLVIKSWGLWASLDSLHLYVDVLVAADEAAGLFFGHLLRRFPQAPARA